MIRLISIVLWIVIMLGTVAIGYLTVRLVSLVKAQKEKEMPGHTDRIVDVTFHTLKDLTGNGNDFTRDSRGEETILLDLGATAGHPFARLCFQKYMGQPARNVEFLVKEITTIGRDINADIMIDDKTISRQHALLLWGNDMLWIEDLDSENGTILNGMRILPKIKVPVPNGAVIALGSTSFSVELIQNETGEPL